MKKDKRITESINYYTRLLNKEMSYSEDLRNKENIDRYINNINKLKSMR